VLRLATVAAKGGDLHDVPVPNGSPVWPTPCQKTGDVVFSVIDPTGHDSLWRVDSKGNNLKQLTNGLEDERPSCSPDGKFVVYQDAAPVPGRLMRVNLDGGSPTAIGNVHLEYPVISPDGKSVAGRYDPGPDKPMTLATIGIGGGEVQNTYQLPLGANIGDEAGAKVAWSRDGRSILFLVGKNAVSNLWAQSLAPTGKTPPAPRQITNFGSLQIWSFSLSPNGGETVFARGRAVGDAVLISHLH
jgi:Tol biopolymer transport system component